MKRFRLLLLLAHVLTLQAAFAQVKTEKLKWTPEFPRTGDKVTVTYDPSKTDLAEEKNIEAIVYMLSFDGMPVAVEFPIKKQGKIYTGSFEVDKSAKALAFVFSADKKKDINGSAGYLVPVYDDSRKPLPGAYLAYSVIYNGLGQYAFGLDAQPETALSYAEKEYTDYPQNRSQSLSPYLQLLNQVKKKEAQPSTKPAPRAAAT